MKRSKQKPRGDPKGFVTPSAGANIPIWYGRMRALFISIYWVAIPRSHSLYTSKLCFSVRRRRSRGVRIRSVSIHEHSSVSDERWAGVSTSVYGDNQQYVHLCGPRAYWEWAKLEVTQNRCNHILRRRYTRRVDKSINASSERVRPYACDKRGFYRRPSRRFFSTNRAWGDFERRAGECR